VEPLISDRLALNIQGRPLTDADVHELAKFVENLGIGCCQKSRSRQLGPREQGFQTAPLFGEDFLLSFHGDVTFYQCGVECLLVEGECGNLSLKTRIPRSRLQKLQTWRVCGARQEKNQEKCPRRTPSNGEEETVITLPRLKHLLQHQGLKAWSSQTLGVRSFNPEAKLGIAEPVPGEP
jgi:hypothetical protein